MYPDMVTRVLDLRHLTWSVTRQSSGTAGSFLKAYEERGGRKRYFKLSSFDAFQGITGHECVNELIADRLLTRLGIPHLSYTLIHANVQIDGADYCTWLCASDDFKEPGESKTESRLLHSAGEKDGRSGRNRSFWWIIWSSTVTGMGGISRFCRTGRRERSVRRRCLITGCL